MSNPEAAMQNLDAFNQCGLLACQRRSIAEKTISHYSAVVGRKETHANTDCGLELFRRWL